MEQPRNKTIFSGLQPSGVLHIGNYLGAIKQWVALQADNTAYYCIVDEHAITVPYDPAQLQKTILDTAALYVACGLDAQRSVIFVQSHVPAHTELAWLLSTITPYGELTRMTQFKDKSRKQADGTSVALFGYPVLMAADILLYHTDAVPVGEDQVQHIELTRTIAERFNKRFGETFTVPSVFLNKTTARIMSLTDPSRKMSKSDPVNTYIGLTDDPNTIQKKIKSAVTETEPVFSFATSGPAVKNLMAIYLALSDQAPQEIEQAFTGKGYKNFKNALAELLVEKLSPIRDRFNQLRHDESHLRSIFDAGSHRANEVASKTLLDVKEKMGLA